MYMPVDMVGNVCACRKGTGMCMYCLLIILYVKKCVKKNSSTYKSAVIGLDYWENYACKNVPQNLYVM